MRKLEHVIQCCREQWDRELEIARRYEEKFPPKWYEFFRKRWRRKHESIPYVGLYLELAMLCSKGVVEYRYEEELKNYSGRALLVRGYFYRLRPGVKLSEEESLEGEVA